MSKVQLIVDDLTRQLGESGLQIAVARAEAAELQETIDGLRSMLAEADEYEEAEVVEYQEDATE